MQKGRRRSLKALMAWGLRGFFCREETFVWHKYAVDPSSIFLNLFLLGMQLQAVPYWKKKTVDF